MPSHSEGGPIVERVNHKTIVKTAVLGAGVMGAQIAAHCVDQAAGSAGSPAQEGAKNGIVIRAMRKLKKLNPAPLGNKDDAALMDSNLGEFLELLRGCDLVIEAIAERLDWKHDLYRKVTPYLAADAIFATNTSGLSIAALSEGFSADLKGVCRAFLRSTALHASG